MSEYKLRTGFKTPVIITRPDDSEHEYESQSKAAQFEDIYQTYISAMCRGKIKMYNGHRARFKFPADIDGK
jgi:hypothetical protein